MIVERPGEAVDAAVAVQRRADLAYFNVAR